MSSHRGHGLRPIPLAIGMVMFRDLTDTARDDIEKGNLMSKAPEERVRTLYPATLGQALSPGSNAWAVSGSRTASGHPILANDTHLGIRIPSIWYEVHLKSPEMNVEGLTITGLPGVVVGHNESICVGRNEPQRRLHGCLSREQINLNTGRYVSQGQTAAAQLDRQEIGVYGARPVTLETWVTRHGPVVYSDGGNALHSVRWTATDGFGYPFPDINRAQDWPAFHAAVGKYWGPPQNFIYADRAGHIGYQASGGMPIRKGFSGDVPLSGASGQQEWGGYVPYEEMPSMLDPPSGIVATAKPESFSRSAFRTKSTGCLPTAIVSSKYGRASTPNQKLTVEDMLAIEKDVYSGLSPLRGFTRIDCGGCKEGAPKENWRRRWAC